MTSVAAETARVIDVRGLPCERSRAAIFEPFDGLEAGETIQWFASDICIRSIPPSEQMPWS
jgi:hypothetical protein